jgi:Trk K+ transport system NAD-binding subunit
MCLQIPENYIGRNFQSLFQYLNREKHILAIALYRTHCEVNYVVTNPQKNTILDESDLIYALGDPEVQYEGKGHEM